MVSFVAPINVFALLHVVFRLDIGPLFLFPPFFFGVGVCSLIKFGKVSTLKQACGYTNPLKVAYYVLGLIIVVVRLATSQLPPVLTKLFPSYFILFFLQMKKIFIVIHFHFSILNFLYICHQFNNFLVIDF